MLLSAEREAVAVYSKRLLHSGLTKGTGGNISIRKGEYAAVTPSATPYDSMTAKDVVVVRVSDGQVVEGEMQPSIETGMHLSCYRSRDDISAIVHTHSPFACTIACMQKEVPAVHYLVGISGKSLPCIPYYQFGSPELAEAAARALVYGQNGILLGNHGLLTCGTDIAAAFNAAEEAEFCCELYWRILATGEKLNTLEAKQMDSAIEALSHYGQHPVVKESQR